MSAAEALRAARMAGIDIRVEDDGLALEAQAPPSAQVLELLAHHKPAIVSMLRPGRDGWSAEDWQTYFDERAGIAEFDGGLTRSKAEATAFATCVAEWLNRNPVSSPPERCFACGEGDHPHDTLLPYGTAQTGCARMQPRYWYAWYEGRKAIAVAALKVIGIEIRSVEP